VDTGTVGGANGSANAGADSGANAVTGGGADAGADGLAIQTTQTASKPNKQQKAPEKMRKKYFKLAIALRNSSC
jgi:hypothetical protein